MSEANAAPGASGGQLPGLLEAGQTATLSFPDKPRDLRYRTFVRGWKEDAFVLLDVPESEGRKLALREGEDCVLRLVSNGVAHACRTNIIDCAAGPKLSYLFVMWPREVQSMAVRRHERLPITCACRLTIDDQPIDARIIDLSPGGCRIETETDTGRAREAGVTATLPGGWSLEGRVWLRSKVESQGRWQLGCQFADGEAGLEEAATEFVGAQAGAARFGADRPKLVLVADGDRGATEDFRRCLEEHGVGVMLASNGLECASRAHSLGASAVALSAALTDIGALQLAAALREAPLLKDARILIYGRGVTADQCRDAGGADYAGDAIGKHAAEALLEWLQGNES